MGIDISKSTKAWVWKSYAIGVIIICPSNVYMIFILANLAHLPLLIMTLFPFRDCIHWILVVLQIDFVSSVPLSGGHVTRPAKQIILHSCTQWWSRSKCQPTAGALCALSWYCCLGRWHKQRIFRAILPYMKKVCLRIKPTQSKMEPF